MKNFETAPALKHATNNGSIDIKSDIIGLKILLPRIARFLISLIFICTLSGLAISNLAYADARELSVKAAFIEKFTHFIKWPDKTEKAHFSICFDEAHPIADIYQQFLKIKQKPVKIIVLNSKQNQKNIKQQIDSCDVLFISGKRISRLKQLLSFVENKGVLTIADQSGFGNRGVMINFYQTAKHIRFEINLSQVKINNFRIDPRLLNVSRIIQGEDE